METPRTPASSETLHIRDGLCQPEMEVQLRRQALKVPEQLRVLVDQRSILDLAVGPPKGDGHLQEKPHLVDWKTFWKDKLRDLCIQVFQSNQADDLTGVSGQGRFQETAAMRTINLANMRRFQREYDEPITT